MTFRLTLPLRIESVGNRRLRAIDLLDLTNPSDWERARPLRDLCRRYGHPFEAVGLPGSGWTFSMILHPPCKRCGQRNPRATWAFDLVTA